jgi:hypothetical protein
MPLSPAAAEAAAARAADVLAIAAVTGASPEDALLALDVHGSRPRAQAFLMARRAAAAPLNLEATR